MVEIKDVEIPEAMQRAMARQAEAERERRAKIINAEGEFQAAEKLAEAAAIIGREPTALQLRYLQTLLEVGGDQNSDDRLPAADRPGRAVPRWTAPARREPAGGTGRALDEWTLMRFLHLVALGFFVGGQLDARGRRHPGGERSGRGGRDAKRAKRFGAGSGVALVVLIGTGVAMASEFERWDDPTLQAKLGLLVLVVRARSAFISSRPTAALIVVARWRRRSLIVWLGVELAYG